MSQQITPHHSDMSGGPFNPKDLSFLWLEVTEKCNLECVHCYADSTPLLPITFGMSYEKWVSVLEEGFSLGCRQVQFIGGEPTLYPALLRLIDHATLIGYEFIEVYTNGTAITEPMFASFIKNKVNLAFSVYSHEPNTHDAITKRKGSLEKTLSSIRNAIKYEIPVRVAVIEMEINQGDVNSLKELLHEIGVQSIGTDRMRGIGRGNGFIQVSDPIQELCGACWQGQLAIDSHGNVYPCVFSRFCNLGNVSSGLGSILDHEDLSSFRRRVKEADEQQDELRAGCSPDDCKPNCKPKCNPGHNTCRPIGW